MTNWKLRQKMNKINRVWCTIQSEIFTIFVTLYRKNNESDHNYTSMTYIHISRFYGRKEQQKNVKKTKRNILAIKATLLHVRITYHER